MEMKMTDTLKKLAELFPEKFEYKPGDNFIWIQGKQYAKVDSQDGIDSILAEVGWEYSIHTSRQPDEYDRNWYANVWPIGMWRSKVRDHMITTPTCPVKLPASQAALKAVVEQFEKEGEKK